MGQGYGCPFSAAYCVNAGRSGFKRGHMLGEIINKGLTDIRLKTLREKQGVTGPNYCLGSSKFFIGKLTGLFDENKRWNDFMSSPWAKKHGRTIDLIAAWGLLRGKADFNSKVLPAAISDPTTNVNGRSGFPGNAVEFHDFMGNPKGADALLAAGVPLVVGVDYAGGSARDHFISVVRDRRGRIWAIDPWGASDAYATAELPSDFSFTKPVGADLNAASGLTTIPCPTPWIGHYRDKRSKYPLSMTASI